MSAQRPGERLLAAGSSLTDAPQLYLEAVRYWVLSSTLGRFVVVPYFPRPPDNPMRPNVWIVLSGVPGIMRKSTVIDGVGKMVVKHAWREYYRATYTRLQPSAIEEMVSKMFIETGSYEGIAKHIAETQGDLDTFFIVSTEWGGILKLSRSRDYMTGFATLLSKLYSGEEHIARYARETRYIRGGLYVTALLGMQEPWLYLDSLVFRQGLMRRMIFVYQTPEDKDRWLPPLDMRRVQVVEQLTDIAEVISNRIRRLSDITRQYGPVEARYTAPAIEAVNSYAQETEDMIRREGSSNWSLYAQNLWEHLAKLAVLEALDRTPEPQETVSGYVIWVSEEDVARAMTFIDRTIPRAREALSLAGTPISEVSLRVSENVEEVIKAVVARIGCAKASDLLKYTRMLKDDLKPIVMNLVEKGDLVAVSRLSGKGRPPIFFCTREAAEEWINRHPTGYRMSIEELEARW